MQLRQFGPYTAILRTYFVMDDKLNLEPIMSKRKHSNSTNDLERDISVIPGGGGELTVSLLRMLQNVHFRI
jgi:hypothetical protein